MTAVAAEIASRKRIALVAHDNKKQDLLEWADYNRELLAHHELLATGTTGGIYLNRSESQKAKRRPTTERKKRESCPIGGVRSGIQAIGRDGTIGFRLFVICAGSAPQEGEIAK